MIIDLFKWLGNFSWGAHMSYQQKQIDRYLSNSSDLADLERRQRELTYGRFKL